uniref:Uncharacterized protein n=1 Tax=Leersia perrieri TaxID=77586 RepID=A0A0D9XFM8_9ORYZ
MGSRSVKFILAVVLAVFAVVIAGTAAARPLPAPVSGGGEAAAAAAYMGVYPAAVVEMLMARLPAGPSPKGPGH